MWQYTPISWNFRTSRGYLRERWQQQTLDKVWKSSTGKSQSWTKVDTITIIPSWYSISQQPRFMMNYIELMPNRFLEKKSNGLTSFACVQGRERGWWLISFWQGKAPPTNYNKTMTRKKFFHKLTTVPVNVFCHVSLFEKLQFRVLKENIKLQSKDAGHVLQRMWLWLFKLVLFVP